MGMWTTSIRLLRWAAFLVPLGYAGMLLAVAVHEGVGHGGTALAFGGSFHGLVVRLDGSGFARSYAEGHRLEVLAGGIVATTVLGFGLLAACAFVRGPLLGSALAVLALTQLLDGLPYGFWNAVSAKPPGDVGRILALADWPPLRPILLIVLGALHLGAVVLGTRALLGAVRRDTGRSRSAEVVGTGVGLTVFTAVGAALFPWEQITGTSTLLVTTVDTALQGLVVLVCLWVQGPAPVARPATQSAWVGGITGSWVLCAGVVAAVACWLARGWFW